MPNFADDWITTGWSHGPDGKWIELGHSAAVKSYPPAELPELPIHAVTDWLNAHDKPVPTNPPSSGVNDVPGCDCNVEVWNLTQRRIEATLEIRFLRCPLHEAAPDLYTALEAILKVMRPGIDGHDDLLHVWLNYPEKPEITPGTLAHAAMAKARGEKPNAE